MPLRVCLWFSDHIEFIFQLHKVKLIQGTQSEVSEISTSPAAGWAERTTTLCVRGVAYLISRYSKN